MLFKRIFLGSGLLLLLSWLTGCAIIHTETTEPLPEPTQRPADHQKSPAPLVRPAKPVERPSRPAAPNRTIAAITRLKRTAAEQVNSGKYTKAVVTLERGLRISPGDAILWQQLAAVRLEQKKWRLALNMAAKSNSLAGQRYTLQADNWRIIAKAWQALGNSNKANHALDKRRALLRR